MNESYSKKLPYFYILTRSWNAFDSFDRYLDSILSQTYKKFKILYIDDASDYTRTEKEYIRKRLAGHIAVFNKKRKFSVFNGYYMIHKFALKRDSVIVNVDADDSLLDPHTLEYLANTYSEYGDKCLLTYGNCVTSDNSKYIQNTSSFLNTKYPTNVIKKGDFEMEPFRVFHLMSFRTSLFKRLKIDSFKDANGSWFKYCLDLCAYLPMLKFAQGRFKFIEKPLYIYNTNSPLINIKKNPFEFVKEDLAIRRKYFDNTKRNINFKKLVFVKHNPLLFVPILSTSIYAIQKYLFSKRLIKTIYMSRRNNSWRDDILRTLLDDPGITVILQSYKFGRIFSRMKNNVISDFIAPSGLKHVPLSVLHDIGWCFILSDFVTTRTKSSFNGFVNTDFPTIDLNKGL